MLTPALKFIIWLTLALLVILLGILMHKHPKSTLAHVLSYLISGATLLIYPGILAAGIMGLASIPFSEMTLGSVITLMFLVLTLLQPVTYVVCLIVSIKRRSAGKSTIMVSLLPFIAPGLAATVLLLL